MGTLPASANSFHLPLLLLVMLLLTTGYQCRANEQSIDKLDMNESKKSLDLALEDDLLKAESQEVAQEHRESVGSAANMPSPVHSMQTYGQGQPFMQPHHHPHPHHHLPHQPLPPPPQHSQHNPHSIMSSAFHSVAPRYAPQFLKKLPHHGPQHGPSMMGNGNHVKPNFPKPSMYGPMLGPVFASGNGQSNNNPTAAQLLAAAAPSANLLHSNLLPSHLLQDGSLELNELGSPILELARHNGQVSPSLVQTQPPSVQPPTPSHVAAATQHSPSSMSNEWPMAPNSPAAIAASADRPKVTHLDVKCEKNLMKVAIEFDRPFNGVIFSKNHFSQPHCMHLGANSARNQAQFDISISQCGTTGNTQNGLYGYGAASGSGTYFENTIVIQYDPQVQEAWDTARKLRCTWHDQYEKAVAFRPFPVDTLDVVKADFAGDNVGCWMQIQVGRGPWASEVAGIVKIGQTMTMVLAIKDEENKFDMLVRNCIAHDGERAPIELVDTHGCIVRPKLMSRFTKIKNFGNSATVLSYAHFQAFKFPDSMEVHFQCTIQICRYRCPEQCSRPGDANNNNNNNNGGGNNGSNGGRNYQVDASIPQHVVVNGRLDQRGSESNMVSSIADASSDGSSASDSSSIGRRVARSIAQSAGVSLSKAIAASSKEIGLNKVIQVVSSGDLAFSLGKAEAMSSDADEDSGPIVDVRPMVCVRSLHLLLAFGCLVLVLLISICCGVALFVRSRAIHQKLRHNSMVNAEMYGVSTLPIRTYGRK